MSKVAAKQGDKIVAPDIHILMVPSPGGPVPTPFTLPFNGTLSVNLSPTVFIEGKQAATVFSAAFNQPVHIPPFPFQKPPSNWGRVFIGSTGVFINGRPAARQGDRAITCNDPVDIPIGMVVATGTVFIGETGAGAPLPPPQPGREPRLIRAKYGQIGKIVNARWERNRARVGDQVRLSALVRGFEDGTPAKFLIWERKGSQDTYIAEVEGEIRGNRAETFWKHSLKDREEELKEEVEEEEEPEYYFVVDIEGEEKISEAFTLTYPLEIYLEDEDGNPLDDVEYTITLSDGTKRRGKFKDGHTKIEDAPYGRFILEVDGYNFILKEHKEKAK